jgi:hypothetical protein
LLKLFLCRRWRLGDFFVANLQLLFFDFILRSMFFNPVLPLRLVAGLRVGEHF